MITQWVGRIATGSSLLALKHTRLWPREMWWSSSTDEDTFVMETAIVTPGDCCGVIDTLENEDNGCTYAALVVCSEGIGCVIACSETFRIL